MKPRSRRQCKSNLTEQERKDRAAAAHGAWKAMRDAGVLRNGHRRPNQVIGNNRTRAAAERNACRSGANLED